MIISYQEILFHSPTHLIATNLNAIAFFEKHPLITKGLMKLIKPARLYEEPCIVVEPFKDMLTAYLASLLLLEENFSEGEKSVIEFARFCANYYQQKGEGGIIPLFFMQPHRPAVLGIYDESIPVTHYHDEHNHFVR